MTSMAVMPMKRYQSLQSFSTRVRPISELVQRLLVLDPAALQHLLAQVLLLEMVVEMSHLISYHVGKISFNITQLCHRRRHNHHHHLHRRLLAVFGLHQLLNSPRCPSLCQLPLSVMFVFIFFVVLKIRFRTACEISIVIIYLILSLLSFLFFFF